MKKFLLTAFVLTLSAGLFAQDFEDDGSFSNDRTKLTVASSDNGLFNLNIFSHIGYGFHIVKSPDFTPVGAGNGEFFFNILEAEIVPADFLGITLGVNIEINHFHSNSHAFVQNETTRLLSAKPFNTIAVNPSKQRGTVNNFGINFPLMIMGNFSDFQIGVGAEASLYLAGSNKWSYRDGISTTSVSQRSPKFNTFGYGIIATVGYKGFDVFFKYYPSKINIFPEGSLNVSYWTIGFAFGL